MTDIKIGTPMCCASSPTDTCVFMEGSKVVALSFSTIVTQRGEAGKARLFIIDRNTMRDQDGDYWRKVPEVKTVYRNAYLDGLGETDHKSFDQAKHATKYGRTRVGIIERRFEDGKLVDAVMHPTEPQMRTPYKEAHNPFLAEAA